MGVTVAGITYDPVEQQKLFSEASGINYPILSDQAVEHVSAYGILNDEYQPGHMGYGIPHPGIIYIDAEGIVRAKFAVPGYRQRPPMADVLAVVTALED